MKKSFKPNLSGFTLIELLVVVLIIGILASIAVPQYQKAVLKAKYTEILIRMKAIVTAQDVYYMANGEYSNDYTQLDIKFFEGETGGWSNGTTSYCNSKGGECYFTNRSFTDTRKGVYMWQSAYIAQRPFPKTYFMFTTSPELAGKMICCYYKADNSSSNKKSKAICDGFGGGEAPYPYGSSSSYTCKYM